MGRADADLCQHGYFNTSKALLSTVLTINFYFFTIISESSKKLLVIDIYRANFLKLNKILN